MQRMWSFLPHSLPSGLPEGSTVMDRVPIVPGARRARRGPDGPVVTAAFGAPVGASVAARRPWEQHPTCVLIAVVVAILIAHAPPASAQAPAPALPAADAAASGTNRGSGRSALDSKDFLASLKEGRLIKYGFTVGQAGAAFIGLDRSRYFATGSMTYAALFPAWWASYGDITRAYCAARFEREDARAITDEMAIDQTIASLRERMARSTSPEDLQSEIDQVTALKKFPLSADDPRRMPEGHNAAEIVYQNTNWDLRLDGKCPRLRWLGVYAGLPSSFTATAQATSTDRDASRQFSPLASFGIAVSPFSSMSILVGVTFSHVTADGGSVVTDHSLTVSVGGNLDLIGYLAGGK